MAVTASPVAVRPALRRAQAVSGASDAAGIAAGAPGVGSGDGAGDAGGAGSGAVALPLAASLRRRAVKAPAPSARRRRPQSPDRGTGPSPAAVTDPTPAKIADPGAAACTPAAGAPTRQPCVESAVMEMARASAKHAACAVGSTTLQSTTIPSPDSSPPARKDWSVALSSAFISPRSEVAGLSSWSGCDVGSPPPAKDEGGPAVDA